MNKYGEKNFNNFFVCAIMILVFTISFRGKGYETV